MNQPERNPDSVEPLILAYLQGVERTVDARQILAGVRRQQAKAAGNRVRPIGPRAARLAQRLAIGLAAASLILGFAWTFRQSTAHADAVKLVHAAQAALTTSPRDRAYRITIDLAPGMAERAPYLAALARADCRLWTRADRLWIEGKRGSEVWACGQDERRHVWIAADPTTGIDFEPEEAPRPLADAIDLFHFDLDATLRLLGDDFDVTPLGATPGDQRAGVTWIRGVPRREAHPRPRLRAITVAIDERTKVVREVILSRLRDGQALAEVSLTWDGAADQPDSAYQLATHLDSHALVFSSDQRLRRRRALARFFGSLLLNEGE